MRILVVEFKRMFFEKKLLWFISITIAYVTMCSLFFNLRFKLDYNYEDVNYSISGFKLWQDNMGKSFMVVLMQVIPSMIYVFSFMDDRENGIDNQICIKSSSKSYYSSKYITVISAGMMYNFFAVILLYFPLYFFLSTGNMGWNYLDRNDALVGGYFAGNTAMEFVLLIAVSYAFVGGVCAGMSCVISLWIENRVLVCILPYFVFKIIGAISIIRKIPKKLYDVIVADVDIFMSERPFSYSIFSFIFWNVLLGILFAVSYTIRIEKKR